MNFEFLLDPVHAVSEYKSPFCISVSDLYSEALPAGDNVGRSICILIDRILDKSKSTKQINGYFFLDDSLKSWEYIDSPALIKIHGEHTSNWIG
jgi:hypothetical protein